MRNIINRLKNNRFFVSAFSIGSGNILAQVISVITVPILSRIYSQEAYGEYGIITSTATIIIAFATLGLTSAIMAPKEDEISEKILKTTFIIQFTVSLLFFVVVVALSPFYLFYNVSGSYFLSAVVMFAYMVFTNLKSLLQVYTNRKGLNKVLFINPLIGAVGNLIIAIPLGLIKFGYMGFFAASIISNIIMCIQMIIRTKPLENKYRSSDFLYVIKTYRKYIIYQCPSNAIGSLAVQTPMQFLSRHFDNTVLGTYTMCIKLMRYPVRLIAAPISTVYFRTASEYHREGKNLADFTYKLITKSLLLAFIPMAAVIFFGEYIFTFVLGNEWSEAGSLASILVFQYVLLFCTQCTSYCRVAIGKQKINLRYTSLYFITTMLFCVGGYLIFKNLYGTIAVLSIGNCIIYIIDMTLNFYCMKKNTGKYLLFIIPYSAISFAMIAIKNVFLK